MQDNRLELFATHDRPHATAPGLAAVIVVDTSVRYQVFAAHADHGHLIFFAQGFLELFFNRKGGFAPQIGGIAQFDFVIVDKKIDRFGAGAFQDEAVDPGIPHLSRKMSTHRGAGIAAGERRFGGPIAFPAARNEHPREGAARNNQLVLRPERVGMHRNFLG